MAKVEKIDMNSSEAKELLKQFTVSIQRIERQSVLLNDEKKDIKKRMKLEGFNTTIFGKVVKKIRDELKKTDEELFEEDIYEEVIKNIVELV